MPARLKKGDLVVVISGKDKGREGKILRMDKKEERVLVEGINIKKMHRRPRKAGEKGSIIQAPAPLNASNVMPKCPNCGKGARIGVKVLAEGGKARICRKCEGLM